MTIRHARRLVLLAAFAVLPSLYDARADTAADADALAIARDYFAHLDNQRLDAARALMAPSIVFEDPTWGGPGLSGPDAVIEAYANTAGFSNLLFDERLAFVSRETVVIHYVVSFDFAPPDDADAEDPIPVIADLVRMATVEDGKVVRHIDLAAYGKLADALAREGR